MLDGYLCVFGKVVFVCSLWCLIFMVGYLRFSLHYGCFSGAETRIAEGGAGAVKARFMGGGWGSIGAGDETRGFGLWWMRVF